MAGDRNEARDWLSGFGVGCRLMSLTKLATALSAELCSNGSAHLKDDYDPPFSLRICNFPADLYTISSSIKHAGRRYSSPYFVR